MGEGFIAIKEQAALRIKEDAISEDINFPLIKSEQDEMSYVSLYLLLDTFLHCSEMPFVFVKSGFLAN